MARKIGWAGVFVGLSIGLWWSFVRLPGSGVSGLALAMGATVMPLLWEKIGPFCKAGWIAMLFLFFFVEVRALEQDRRDSSNMLTKKFGEISQQANDNLKKILEDEHTSFARVLEAEDQRFSQTMAAILSSQRRNDQEFAELLKHQKDLFDKQNEMVESLNGHLLPSDDPMPVINCEGLPPVGKQDYLLITPASTDIVELPFVVLRVHQHDMITLTKAANGLLELRMNIRNADGSLIARFDEDGFEVNPGLYKRHPDKSTLIVEDAFGNETLRVRYANPRVLYLRGKINIDGHFVGIPFGAFGNSTITGSCSYHSKVEVDIQ